MRMGVKDTAQYLYDNFEYNELTSDGLHIAVGVASDILDTTPEKIIKLIMKLELEKMKNEALSCAIF